MNSEARKIRDVIEGFLEERLAAKLEPLAKALAKDPVASIATELQAKIDLLASQFLRETWLESAAARVGQLQLVHFAAKFSNPYSKSSGRYLPNNERETQNEFVCSSMKGLVLEPDVVGNAAVLDTFKFLSQKCGEKSLLEFALGQDEAFSTALSDDLERGKEWARCFAAISEVESTESHQYAKQVYFPIGESEYHLISPLYPTSLAHAVKARIDDSRFGEPSKEARKARRAGQWSDHGYAEYSNLTVQNFGGTKPQNVSQLNSQRRGEALLLASCPPSWDQHAVRPPLASSSVFRSLLYRHASVREAVDKLAKFLLATDYNNANIRRERARLVEVICDEVLFVASSIQSVESGWSAKPECKLDTVEALWLDPGRALEDEGFAERQRAGDYTSEVASRFAKWLNGALKRKKLVLGDVEYKEWQSLLLREIRSLPLEVHV